VSAAQLTGRQRRELRARGHSLTAIVQVGKEGVTDALVKALDVALTTHELVKVKIGQSSPIDRHEAATELSTRTESAVAQVLGNTVLLYRENPEEEEKD
jgi:RNA-binding protein